MNDFVPVHGGQLGPIAARFGVPEAQLLDFSANINPDGPPLSVLAALRNALDDTSLLTRYPDMKENSLKQSLAKYAGVGVECISVANGFVPLLEAALRALSVRSCAVPEPAFVEYRRTLARNSVALIPFAHSAASDFHYDIDAMLASRSDAILLANPQNPSGLLTSPVALLHLVAAAQNQGTRVLLDEAFIDYMPEASLIDAVRDCRNLVVFRSVTKFFTMPALRVAYAVAHREVCTCLDESLAPWPIATLASLGAAAAVRDEAFAQSARSLNVSRRERLRTMIEQLGIYVYPSEANFLLMRLPVYVDASIVWHRLIGEHHIVVRDCSNYHNLPHGHLRVAVRAEADNHDLVVALQKVLT